MFRMTESARIKSLLVQLGLVLASAMAALYTNQGEEHT